MAFPTIQTADTKNGTVTSNTTNWPLTYPTNIAAGDLLLAFVGMDGTTSITFPAGWVGNDGAAGANRLAWGKRIADGSETGTFNLTNSSEQGGWRVFRITGWEGTIGTTFNNAASTGAIAAGLMSTGTNANPDPPSLDPTNWATEDTLWFAVCSIDTSRTISVYPLADNQTADVSGGAGGATLGVCTQNNAVSSLDPGTFTQSAADDWAAQTIAVRPAAAAGTFVDNEELMALQAVSRASVW